MSMIRQAKYAGLLALVIGSAVSAAPVNVSLPANAELLRQQTLELGTLILPTGPADGDVVPARTYEGRIFRRSWRFVGDLTVLQVLAPLRDQLFAEGFEEVYACEDRLCGGFAFRFGIDVIPAPDMSVNLTDFMFLSARQPETGVVLSVLASRTADVTHLQVLEREDPDTPALPEPSAPLLNGVAQNGVGDGGNDQVQQAVGGFGDPRATFLADAVMKSKVISTGDVGELLLLQGHVPLLDLEFSSGSDGMGEGPNESLSQLAAFLKAQDTAEILLVGHTDTIGTLEANVKLSRRRAASVRERLIKQYDIGQSRISVAGAGYMSPLAPNTTQEGRDINRRVEAVLVKP